MRRFLTLISIFYALAGYAQPGGLTGEYYNGMNFDQHVLTRFDGKIGFSRRLESPCPGIGEEYFSIRWTGSIYAPATGLYTFHMLADDGIRLWINKTKIIEGWYEQEATSYDGEIMLEKGQYYDIRIDYFNSIIHSVIALSWEMPPETYELFGNNVVLNFGRRTDIPDNYFLPKPSPERASPSFVMMKPADEQPPVAREVVAETQTKPTRKTTPVQKIEKPLELDHTFVLKQVIFPQQKYDIPVTAYEELDRISKYLLEHPTIMIEIRGHTDYIGDSLDNQILSENRAKAVEDYLLGAGVAQHRVYSKGYGGRYPLVVSEGEDRIRNRRVEFILRD